MGKYWRAQSRTLVCEPGGGFAAFEEVAFFCERFFLEDGSCSSSADGPGLLDEWLGLERLSLGSLLISAFFPGLCSVGDEISFFTDRADRVERVDAGICSCCTGLQLYLRSRSLRHCGGGSSEGLV